MKEDIEPTDIIVKYLFAKYNIRKSWCIMSKFALSFENGEVLQTNFEEHIREYALSFPTRKHFVLFGWVVDELNNKKEFLYDTHFNLYIEIDMLDTNDLLFKIRELHTTYESQENKNPVHAQLLNHLTRILMKVVSDNINEIISKLKDRFDNFFN